MKSRQTILALVAVAILGVASWLTVRGLSGSGETEDFPDGIAWLCTEATCGEAFLVTLDDMSGYFLAHPDQQALPCPTCGGQKTVRAARCPDCGRFYPRDLVRASGTGCPYCAKTAAHEEP